jgi:hypothetical protein
MKRRRLFFRGAALVLVLIALLALGRGVLAQSGAGSTLDGTAPQLPSMASSSYALHWNVVGYGGGTITSTSYRLQSTIGQNAIGTSTSTSYKLHAGFWQMFYNYVYLPLILR